MSLSKYCRYNNINLIDLSKTSGIEINDLFIIYMDDPSRFDAIVGEWRVADERNRIDSMV